MANHEPDIDRLINDGWVDDRIASLELVGGLIPNAGLALVRLRERNRARATAMGRWILTTVAGVGAGAILLLAPASRACAEQPGPCVQRVWSLVGSTNRVSSTDPVGSTNNAAPLPVVASNPPRAVKHVIGKEPNFRQAGSDSAPVCVEIYLDFDCPHCAAFIRDVVPALTDEYVRTGKARLLYRDYPLPTHRFAKLAARYADTAGQLGYYDAAMKQILETRQAWDENGDIDSQLALVLPPDVMETLRNRIDSDPEVDNMLSADLAAGLEDHLDRTPLAVIVHEGKREAITDAPLSFAVLKSRIDELVAGLVKEKN